MSARYIHANRRMRGANIHLLAGVALFMPATIFAQPNAQPAPQPDTATTDQQNAEAVKTTRY